jgi:5'-nucleotidase / UDP-sugar diphosphatase
MLHAKDEPMTERSLLLEPKVLVLLLVAVTLLATSCLNDPAAPDLEGVPVRLTLLHLSDIHSRIFPYDMVPQYTDQELGLEEGMGPYGGAARLATILEQERAAAGRVLTLDSGDVFQGGPVFNLFEGEVEIQTLARLGVDAAVVGNHEFDRGAANYATQLERWSTFYSLAANYDFESANQPWNSRLDALVDPFAVFDLDGLTVGVIGMGNLSSITSIHEADNSLDLYARDTLMTVRHYAARLEPQVDLVVVLSHLGLGDDVEIARLDPNVDIVLGGHLHVSLDPIKVVESDAVPGKRVLVSAAGAFAKFGQRIDLVVLDGDIITHDSELIPIDSLVPDDPEVSDMLEDYGRLLVDTMDLGRVVAHTNARLRRFGNDGGDSPLGNLVAEAMQSRTGVETDFGLTNSLGIRSDIEGPGGGEDSHQVTIEELYNVLPFDNTITTMFLSGVEVQELFDYVTRRSASRGCNAQAQIASARFVMDCGTERALDVTIGGTWDLCSSHTDCVDQGEICSAGRCGRPIEPSESYELATNNYIAGGGSGFAVLENNTTSRDTGISMRDAVQHHMLQIGQEYTIPLNEAYPDGDGRITPRF